MWYCGTGINREVTRPQKRFHSSDWEVGDEVRGQAEESMVQSDA